LKKKQTTVTSQKTKAQRSNLENIINKSQINNTEIISDEKIKDHILKKSIFAVSKSGTISLEISKRKIPSIIIYKMNFINFLIVKMLVKIKYANIINIAANEEIIPELLQSNCNSNNIFNKVDSFFENNQSMQNQIDKSQEVIKNFKTNQSSEIAASVLINSF
jgi:lipid-A-disaccharide synthase